LLADAPLLTAADQPDPEAVVRFLDQQGIRYTTFDGWQQLDEHEKNLGAAEGRERIKVVDRHTMVSVSRG
ncbi:MAG: pyridine nucleotide-disulfide oxidoreductase, partial [Umezawaea sp.]